jgi:hypothetical protein
MNYGFLSSTKILGSSSNASGLWSTDAHFEFRGGKPIIIMTESSRGFLQTFQKYLETTLN